MLGYVTERLCLHLNQLTPTVSNCYIHVNMAEAGVVAVALVMLEWPEKKKISVEQQRAEPYRDGVLALMRRGGGSAQAM